MDIKPLLRGIATHIPGLYKFGPSFVTRGTGGTISSRYCYSVWLRHLIMAYKNGLSTRPGVVAELGPGDSLGIGLAALLSGADAYYAFDTVKYANRKRNIEIFDELIRLFTKRARIPDETEFPSVEPCLQSYEFPAHILTDDLLAKALRQDRIESIRVAILNLGTKVGNSTCIFYFAPWNDSKIVMNESVDMIYSQAVLEHVEDLADTYEILYRWLKPSGFMSHAIDFRSHGTAPQWNGHWAYSDFVWRLIKGKMPYLLNRQSHSTYINLMKKIGFEIICDIKTRNTMGIERKSLASRFKNMSDEDFTTSTTFIHALKKQPIHSNVK